MGGKAGSSSSGPPKVVKKTMRDQRAAALPVLNEISKQIMEALTTGGVNARIPIMQRIIEAGRHATAQAVRGAEETSARANLGPYGRGLIEGIGQQGEFATNQAGMSVIQSLMDQAADFGLLRGSGAFGASSPVSKGTGDASGGISALFNIGAGLGGSMAGLGGAITAF